MLELELGYIFTHCCAIILKERPREISPKVCLFQELTANSQWALWQEM